MFLGYLVVKTLRIALGTGSVFPILLHLLHVTWRLQANALIERRISRNWSHNAVAVSRTEHQQAGTAGAESMRSASQGKVRGGNGPGTRSARSVSSKAGWGFGRNEADSPAPQDQQHARALVGLSHRPRRAFAVVLRT